MKCTIAALETGKKPEGKRRSRLRSVGMRKFSVRMTLENDNGELSASERSHINSQYTAGLGWCIGETLADALGSLCDVMVRGDNILKDSAEGFADGINARLPKD